MIYGNYIYYHYCQDNFDDKVKKNYENNKKLVNI